MRLVTLALGILVTSCLLLGCKSARHQARLSTDDEQATIVSDGTEQEGGALADATRRRSELPSLQCSMAPERLVGCTCWPDIVPRLQAGLFSVKIAYQNDAATWMGWTSKTLACQNILGEFSEVFGGWDFQFPQEPVVDADGNTNLLCGSCGRDQGAKSCYDARLGGRFYRYDMWDINYSLYGMLQGLCNVPLVDAWMKIRAWKGLKAEYSERLWFWFQIGYYMAKTPTDQSETIEAVMARHGLVPPANEPLYKDCLHCQGDWRSHRPLKHKNYLVE